MRSNKVSFAKILPLIFMIIFSSTIVLGLPFVLPPLPPVAAIQESVGDGEGKDDEGEAAEGEEEESTKVESTELPTAEIISNGTKGVAPAAFEFKANVIGSTEPYTYGWDFDDGSDGSDDEQTVMHTFDEAGTYNVTLAATDTDNQNTFDSIVINVEEPEAEEAEEARVTGLADLEELAASEGIDLPELEVDKQGEEARGLKEKVNIFIEKPVEKEPPGRQEGGGGDVSTERHTGASGSTDPCGDGSRQYVLDGLRWTTFPVRYHIDPSAVTSGVDKTAAKQAVVEGFKRFDKEEHPAGTFFIQTSDPSTAKIKVWWAALDGPSGTLAESHIYYYEGSTSIVEVEIIFDTSEKWFISSKWSCTGIAGSPHDIQNTATHEVGHAVGLDHATGTGGTTKLTMYSSARAGETLKRSLGIGDQRGVDAIY